MKKVTIIGLGYVGLPLAILLAKNNYNTYGYDISEKIVKKTNKGISHIQDKYLQSELSNLKNKIIATTDPKEALNDTETIVVCVPTPIDKNHLPDLTALKSASTTISKHLKKGTLVIIESTIAPGTCEEIVKPILEKSNLKIDKDFFLAHCPERIDPGNTKFLLEDLPRVIGGSSQKAIELAHTFYSSIIKADIMRVSSLKAAEAIKIVENSFRDINIAFVNELAKSFDKLDIDVTEVIKGASTKPFAFMPHFPGVGVGGHCISVDPYYLIDKASSHGFNHEFMRLARKINNSMPSYTIERTMHALQKINKTLNETTITVLGVAYKKNVDDPRESPALKLIEKLKQLKCNFKIYDPYLPNSSTVKSLDAALENECIILCTDHDEFLKIKPSQLKTVKVFIDGRNCMDKKMFKSLEIEYLGIGRQ
jgi:UDP-N-acetyl-D-glucosamine dehydrogenase